MPSGIRWSWLGAALVGCGVVAAWYAFSGPPRTPAERQFAGIMDEWRRANRSSQDALRDAIGNVERQKIRQEREADQRLLAERCLTLAQTYPESPQALASLCWAAAHAPEADAGRKARDVLVEGRIASSDLQQLSWALDVVGHASQAGLVDLAPRILDRIKQSPDDPLAAPLLTRVCTMTRGDESRAEVSPTFAEAADLLVAHHAASPDIANFCECFGLGLGSPPWAQGYERHLRTILERNQDRRVRTVALYAVASLVQETGEDRQAEAATLYERFLGEFPGNNPTSDVENELNKRARTALKEIHHRGVGLPAPEITGYDMAGKPMALSGFRGKVVLLSFWATWCSPCMKQIPHERELAEKFRGKPFAIVGVNCDSDEAAAQQAVSSHRMSWRSFRDQGDGELPISEAWDVLGYPTLYLIDHAGSIRKRWIGTPPASDLDREVERLVEEASGGG